MRPSAELETFSDRLGHRFSQPDLLIRAVTHASISTATRPDNQRLEFLGDRVLGLVMAEALLHADPNAEEGRLAPRFNTLVRKETCADVARQLDLGAVQPSLAGPKRPQDRILLADAARTYREQSGELLDREARSAAVTRCRWKNASV